MRFPGDNKDEMRGLTISDREVERLLSGSYPGTGELAALVPMVRTMRASGRRIPSASAAERFAAQAAAIVRSTGGGAGTVPEPAPGRRWALTPRLVGAVAAALVVFAISGVAVAANGASPGGSLYGLDRALERVGIGAGGAEERLEEAGQLVADGYPQEALAHIDEAFDQAESEGEDVASLTGARAAVEDAAARLLGAEGSDTIPLVVKDEVEALLRFIQDNVHKDVGVDGKEFGQRVAELARDIAVTGTSGEPGDDPGTTSTTEDENGNGNGGGNGSGSGNEGGNGPPEGSPSETAPGRGNKP